MTHEDYTKPLIKALLEPKLNQQRAISPAGEDGSVCLRTEPRGFDYRKGRRRVHEATDNK